MFLLNRKSPEPQQGPELGRICNQAVWNPLWETWSWCKSVVLIEKEVQRQKQKGRVIHSLLTWDQFGWLGLGEIMLISKQAFRDTFSRPVWKERRSDVLKSSESIERSLAIKGTRDHGDQQMPFQQVMMNKRSGKSTPLIFLHDRSVRNQNELSLNVWVKDGSFDHSLSPPWTVHS